MCKPQGLANHQPDMSLLGCRLSEALGLDSLTEHLVKAVAQAAGADGYINSMCVGIVIGFTELVWVVCRLSGALGLDKLTEQLVGAVAQAAGVSEPAQPGTPAEAKQVVALETLLQVASGPRAGLLGSGWVLLLRTLSSLESLQVETDLDLSCLHWPAGPCCCAHCFLPEDSTEVR